MGQSETESESGGPIASGREVLEVEEDQDQPGDQPDVVLARDLVGMYYLG